jgi:cell division protein FtsB
LNNELRDLSYAEFRAEIRRGQDAQEEFDKLRNEEKDLNMEIKRLNEEFKRA